MITFFTTPKPFEGETGIRQRNALRNWRWAVPGAEVIVFDTNPDSQAMRDLGCRLLVPERLSPEGTPRIDEMFERAQEAASHSHCCFVNADILLTPDFIRSLQALVRRWPDGFLAIGERIDTECDTAIDFASDAAMEQLTLLRERGTPHPPLGSDYFLFPKGQYPLGTIPPLLVGRANWDLWMIYDGRRRRLPVVDLSEASPVIHQNHDYNHRNTAFSGYENDPEAHHNRQFFPAGRENVYILKAASHRLTSRFRPVSAYAGGDREYYQEIWQEHGHRIAPEFWFRFQSARELRRKAKAMKSIDGT